MTQSAPDERLKQIVVGAGVLAAIGMGVCGGLLGWGHLPGALGEWVGTMVGVLTTPFFMEASFLVLGLCVVVVLNHWHAKREGDEFVHLESVESAELKEDVSDSDTSAVSVGKPLDTGVSSLLEQVEASRGGDDDGRVAHSAREVPRS